MFKSFHSRHSPESISHLKKKICHHQTHSDLFLFPDGMSSVFMSQLYSDHNFSLDLIRPQLANFPTKYFMYFTKQIVDRGMYQSNVLRIQKTNLSINLPGLPASVVLVLECICLSWILPSDKEAGRKEKCNTYTICHIVRPRLQHVQVHELRLSSFVWCWKYQRLWFKTFRSNRQQKEHESSQTKRADKKHATQQTRKNSFKVISQSNFHLSELKQS